MQKRAKIRRNAQAALEFLMTYGWIITTVLVAIGALAYFGVLNPDKFLPRKCIVEAGIGCMDFKVQEDSVTLVLRNGKGEDITISQIAVKDCIGANLGVLKNGEQATYKVGGCTNNPNAKFSGDINITYTSDSGISKKKSGSLIDKVETGCGLCACAGTDTSCGSYPACNNCNSQDSYSANYCLSNNVYRDFNNYSCVTQSCTPTTTPQLVPPSCTASNGICQSAQCVCAGTVSSCGTFPSCNACAGGQICQSGSCVNAVASLSASHTITSIQDLGDGWKRYNYDLTLTESAGVNVNIQSTYSLCSALYGCVSLTATFGLITGGTSATRSGYFDTTPGDTITNTYNWNDVNGNSGTVSRTMPAP